MEWRDIEYFAVLAEHGHVGRAAEALRLSQPAVSKSLRRLEDALEVKLVKRTPKGVEVTPEGSALLMRVRGLRVSLRDLAREIKDVSHGRAGHLRIGVGESLAEYLLPSAFEKMLREAPQLSLKVVVSDNDRMLPELRNGELDLVVNYLVDPRAPALPEGVSHEPLYEDEMLVCASATHPLAKRKRVALDDLVGQRWALTDPLLQPMRFLAQAFLERGLSAPRSALESRSNRIRFESIACSDLLDYTSRLAFQHSAARYRLKEIRVPELKRRRTVGAMYRDGAYVSPAARRLLTLLREAARFPPAARS
jgi:DNA-binding transcriptional LysR family regulator